LPKVVIILGRTVNHGRTGDKSPAQNMEWGTLMQIVPQILPCFKISHTILLALKCSKRLINLIILTEYSIFSKSTSSMSTKSSLQVENSTFFWKGHGQKVPVRMHQNTLFKFFLGVVIAPSPVGRVYLPHPAPGPHQAFWIHCASPRIPARFMPLIVICILL